MGVTTGGEEQRWRGKRHEEAEAEAYLVIETENRDGESGDEAGKEAKGKELQAGAPTGGDGERQPGKVSADQPASREEAQKD